MSEVDEDYPDCSTARERELYFALMLIAGAALNYQSRAYPNWIQGGVKVQPIVARALRLREEDAKRHAPNKHG